MRFASVTLATPDPARLAGFYAALGFDVKGAEVRVGATTLRLVHADPEGPVHLAFNVAEHRFADAKAWLSRHVPLRTEDGQDEFEFGSWDARASYFEDPDGNVLEIIARHRLRSAFQGPFGARGVEGVSEVGLPVGDVLGAVDRLSRELGEPPFQPPQPQFSPVGDDHGLLIVVPRGRGWFPTSKPARSAPLEVLLEDGRLVPLALP